MPILQPKETQLNLEVTDHTGENPKGYEIKSAILTDNSVVIVCADFYEEGDPELWTFQVTDEQAQQIRKFVTEGEFSLSCEWYWGKKGLPEEQKALEEYSEEDDAEADGYALELRVEF